MTAKASLSRRTLTILWGVVATLVLLVALGVSIARMVLPALDDHRARVSQLVAERLQRPVEIGRLSAGWGGLNPQLRLLDVRIGAPRSGDVLQVGEIRLVIDLLDSLVHGRMRLAHVQMRGVALDVTRAGEGRYRVRQWPTRAEASRSPPDLKWLAASGYLRLDEVQIRYHDLRISTVPVALSDASLRVAATPDGLRISGAAQLDGARRYPLQFVVHGDESARVHRMYLEGAVPLGSWLDGEWLAPTPLRGGHARLRLWADRRERETQMHAEFRLNGVEVTSANATPTPLGDLAGRLFMRADAQGWSLRLHDLQGRRGGQSWIGSTVDVRSAAAGRRWTGRMEWVDVSALQDWLRPWRRRWPEQWVQADRWQLRGRLQDLQFRLDRAMHANPRYSVIASVQDFGFRIADHDLRLAGVDGRLMFNEQRGYFDSTTRGLQIAYPRWFAKPLTLQRMRAPLYWTRRDWGLEVMAPEFAARNRDLRQRGRLALQLPRDASPLIDLQTEFFDGRINAVTQYLPVKRMPPGVVRWLKQGLSGGRVRSGQLLLFGPLRAFPFTSGEGVFRADLEVEDLNLDYLREWPRGEEISASLRFEGRSLSARLHSGKVFDLDLRPSRLSIAQLNKKARLDVRLNVAGPHADMLRYLRQIPLGRNQPLLNDIRLRGDGGLALNLDIPLLNPAQAQVSGNLRLDDAVLSIPPWGIEASDARGSLQFEHRGEGLHYRAEDIRARYRGQPVRVDVETAATGEGLQTRVDVLSYGEASLLFGDRLPQIGRLLRGDTDWHLQVAIDRPRGGTRPRARLQVASDLRGARVALPSPLAKAPSAGRELTLEIDFDRSPDQTVRLRYGDLLTAVARHRDGRLPRLGLTLGDGKAELPQAPGWVVRGRWKEFSLSQWQAWLADHGTGTSPSTPQPARQPLRRLRVRFDELELFGQTLRKADVQITPAQRRWRLELDSLEAQGVALLAYPFRRDEPLWFDFERLRLAPVQSGGKRRLLDPRELPPLRLAVKDLTYDGVDMGKVALTAEPAETGLAFPRLTIDAETFSVSAEGEWLTREGRQLSNFDIAVKAPDLGRALTDSGFANAMRGGETLATIDAQWSGSPMQFSLKNLDGQVRVLVKDGELVNVKTRGGNWFGLLSVQALPRRLALDFSDLFGKGFSFNRIEGSFSLAEGNAYTSDLTMEGPAAQVELAGRIGLLERDYDQTVTVMPRVSSTLPLVGGIAGGPGVGIGLWVADQLFGDQLARLTRIPYEITGTWEDPQVRRAEAPDS